jgi:hypothetical protein
VHVCMSGWWKQTCMRLMHHSTFTTMATTQKASRHVVVPEAGRVGHQEVHGCPDSFVQRLFQHNKLLRRLHNVTTTARWHIILSSQKPE